MKIIKSVAFSVFISRITAKYTVSQKKLAPTMFQNNLGITCQSLVILAERIIIQLPAEMERSILVENHLHCFRRDGRLSRPWCEVAPANI